MDRSLILLVVGLVIGVGAGLFAGSAVFGGRAQLPSDEVVAMDRTDSVEAGRAGRAPEVEAERVEGDAARLAPIPATLSEALRAWPQSAPRNGEGWITGRVLDQDGHPVPDVTVRAQRVPPTSLRSPSRPGQGSPREASLEEQVRGTIERYHQRQADRREATSDSAGEFRLGGVLSDAYRMTAYKKGWKISSGTREARSGEEVEFTASFLIPVHITLLRASGEAAERGTIVVKRSTRTGSSSSIELWTRDVPTLLLGPGEYTLFGHNTERGDRGARPDEEASDLENLTLSANQESAELTLRMKGQSGIFGTVSGAHADGFDNGRVLMMRLPKDGEVNLKLLAESDTNEWLGSRSEDYAFRDLVPGEYAVGLSRSYRGRVVTHQVVSVGESMVECDLEMPPLDPTQCLVAEVKGPDGKPLAKVQFSLSYEKNRGNSHSSGSTGLVTSRRENGDWWLFHEPGSDRDVPALFSTWGPGIAFQLTVMSQKYGSWETELSEGQRAVAVTFSQPGILHVTVAGYAGFDQPERLSVRVSGPGSSVTTPSISPEGEAKAGPMVPGDYDVRLMVESDWGRDREVSSTPVTVGAGEQSMTIAVPTLHSLSVVAPSLTPGETLRLSSVGERSRSNRAELDEDLRAKFDFLPAGRYRLEGNDGGQMEVVVPSGEIVFAPVSPNALAVSISDPHGELAKAGFRDGDVVVSIGGKGFENMVEMQGAMMSVMAAETVEFGVARGAKTVILTLDGAHLRNGDSMGGKLEPFVR